MCMMPTLLDSTWCMHEQVWFLRGLGENRSEREFVASLSMKLNLCAYVFEERLPLGQMYVLRKGVVVKLWRFLGAGKVRTSPHLS